MARGTLTWPNVEKFTVAWIKAATSRDVWTETASSLADNLPTHRVQRIGGGTGPDGITKTYQVEVTTYAASRGSLWDSVAQVETAMENLASNGTESWYVDEVTETFAAASEPYENGDVRSATATYGIAVRPRTNTP